MTIQDLFFPTNAYLTTLSGAIRETHWVKIWPTWLKKMHWRFLKIKDYSGQKVTWHSPSAVKCSFSSILKKSFGVAVRVWMLQRTKKKQSKGCDNLNGGNSSYALLKDGWTWTTVVVLPPVITSAVETCTQFAGGRAEKQDIEASFPWSGET